ncbi:hypothetical protein [Lysinibacillus fusiformis]|uniref:hypothetical protein n=1 Tax=Lysinibacillus fusiformis TaxID=28031 RepID=UPI003AAC0CEF
MAITQLGRRIYYLVSNGALVLDTGEYLGYGITKRTTKEEDFLFYPELSKYVFNDVAHIDLSFGEFREEFITCLSFRVNPKTKKLEFAYQDSDVFEKPLVEQLKELKSERQQDQQRIKNLELMLAKTKSI